MSTVHGYTDPTTDVRTWLAVNFPTGDVAVAHSAGCSAMSNENECHGNCAVVDGGA